MTVHINAQPPEGPFPPAADPDERHEIARYHAALFPTRLAIARWQHGGHLPLMHIGGARRAAWHAAARRDFQAWLDRGGFTQYDNDSAPHDDSHPAHDGDTEQIDACN